MKNTKGIEKRVFKFEKLEVEERADGMGPKITGYAAVFNKFSDDLGGFREKIKPGAFKKALMKSDARGLFNHDSNFILGRQSNKTLRITEDKNGLWMEIDPPDTQIIQDLVLAPIKRGDIKEQSFSFIVSKGQEWDNLDGEKKNKPVTRTITEVDELFDVSPVTFPAYPDTSVALRCLEEARKMPFEPADDRAILAHEVAVYLEDKGGTSHRGLAAYNIIKMVEKSLSAEQRAELFPTQTPIKADSDLNVDNDSDDKGDDKADPIEIRKDTKSIDDRYKEFKLKFTG